MRITFCQQFLKIEYPLQEGSGRSFWPVVAMSSAARLFVEAFRGDSIIWTGFRASQIIALFVLAVSFWMLHKWVDLPSQNKGFVKKFLRKRTKFSVQFQAAKKRIR